MDADELPEEVFTALGRVTWAAIKLEDYVECVCSFIEPRNPRDDNRFVTTKIKDAKRVLQRWPVPSTRDKATGWLERAKAALERRNALFHATPLVWIAAGRSESAQRLLLGEMPRGNRPYTERPLTVDAMMEVHGVLTEAADGWRELVIAVGEDRKQS